MINVALAWSPKLQALVRKSANLDRVVADEKNDAAGEKLEADQLVNERRRLGIEGGRGLIEEQNAGLIDQPPRERHAQPLSSRELADWAV